MLIYQVDNGSDNSGKLPSGGVIGLWTVASSMSVVVANPITFYTGAVIDQVGQSGDLYNYYWTSYSRGTDGEGHWNAAPVNKPNVHNLYLDSYIPLRHKSIYDPCPYGYRIPSNGTYNQFLNTGWITGSCIGGVNWNLNEAISWIATTGSKIGYYNHVGTSIAIYSSTPNQTNQSYAYIQIVGNLMLNSWSAKSAGSSVRCIEECELLLARKILKTNETKAPHSETFLMRCFEIECEVITRYQIV